VSSNISYRVRLKDNPDEIRIDAEDVNLDCPCSEFSGESLENMTCSHEKAWFNFTKESITVAAIPYAQIVYIID